MPEGGAVVRKARFGESQAGPSREGSAKPKPVKAHGRFNAAPVSTT